MSKLTNLIDRARDQAAHRLITAARRVSTENLVVARARDGVLTLDTGWVVLLPETGTPLALITADNISTTRPTPLATVTNPDQRG